MTDNRFQDLLFDVTLSGGEKPRKLLFSLEVQSRQEWDMAIRMHHYNGRQYMLQAECRFEMFRQFTQSCLLSGLSPQEIARKLIDIFKATDAEVELLLRPVN